MQYSYSFIMYQVVYPPQFPAQWYTRIKRYVHYSSRQKTSSVALASPHSGSMFVLQLGSIPQSRSPGSTSGPPDIQRPNFNGWVVAHVHPWSPPTVDCGNRNKAESADPDGTLRKTESAGCFVVVARGVRRRIFVCGQAYSSAESCSVPTPWTCDPPAHKRRTTRATKGTTPLSVNHLELQYFRIVITNQNTEHSPCVRR